MPTKVRVELPGSMFIGGGAGAGSLIPDQGEAGISKENAETLQTPSVTPSLSKTGAIENLNTEVKNKTENDAELQLISDNISQFKNTQFYSQKQQEEEEGDKLGWNLESLQRRLAEIAEIEADAKRKTRNNVGCMGGMGMMGGGMGGGLGGGLGSGMGGGLGGGIGGNTSSALGPRSGRLCVAWSASGCKASG